MRARCQHLCACDLAVVRSGLTTAKEQLIAELV